MSVSLAKVTTPATVSLVKDTDAAYALRMVRPVTNDLIANDLDALAEVFRIQEIRALSCLEDNLHALDTWNGAYGVDYAPNAIAFEREIDAQLDALTAGKYAATR